MSRLIIWSALALGFFAVACSDDGGTTADTTVADTTVADTTPTDTTPADTTPPAPIIGDLTVEMVNGSEDYVPVEAETFEVRLILGDGTVVDKQNGDDGLVTFEDVNWSAGTGRVSVIAGNVGWIVRGYAEMPKSFYDNRAAINGGAVELAMFYADATVDTVKVSGEVTGMVDETHRLAVSTSALRSRWHDRVGADYSVRVARSMGFDWAAMEFTAQYTPRTANHTIYRAVVGQSAGGASDLEMDIDLTDNPQTILDLNVTYPLPDSTVSNVFSTGQPAGFVHCHGLRGPQCGLARSAAPNSAADAIDVRFSYFKPSFATDALTIYQMASNSELSRHIVMGWPDQAVAQTVDLPTPPHIITPSGGQGQPVDEPIVWETDVGDEDLLVGLMVITGNSQDREVVGSFFFPPGTTEARVPSLPLDTDPFEFLEVSQLGVQIALCEFEATERDCMRFSRSRLVVVNPAEE